MREWPFFVPSFLHNLKILPGAILEEKHNRHWRNGRFCYHILASSSKPYNRVSMN